MKTAMDLIREKIQGSTELDSESSTLVPEADEPEIVARMNTAMTFLLKDVMDSPNTSRRTKFMMSKIWEEAMFELRGAPEEIVEEQFLRTTAVMYWIATGQPIQNIPMPEGFWDYTGATLPDSPQAPELESVSSTAGDEIA